MANQAAVLPLAELLTLREGWKREGKTVVWTNGVFDLVHAGHVRSLSDAKALGDILIVGVNSDSSVKKNKGPLRPVISEQDRAELLAALKPVDYVTIFDDTEPSAILSQLRPDIHCKGAEYADGSRPIPERAVVEAYGGRVVFLPFHAGRSTTDLIRRTASAIDSERSAQ